MRGESEFMSSLDIAILQQSIKVPLIYVAKQVPKGWEKNQTASKNITSVVEIRQCDVKELEKNCPFIFF